MSETEEATIWRTCHVITGDCKRCPASEMVGGDECVKGCRLQAQECVNVVETGNPWRKTAQADLRAPWIALWPTGEGVSGGVAPHVFLDCDGVLADFDIYAHAYFGKSPRQAEKEMGSDAFWASLEAKGDFFRNLPLMDDARALYEGVKHLNPTILTGCPRGTWAQGQKVEWAAEHFPGVPIITCRSADKRDFAKPGDVLIDDWAQHRHRWIEMGGVFVTHHDAASSLAALWAHYPALRGRGEGGAGEGQGAAGTPSSGGEG